mgnify:CR=1 FL=1
MKIYVLIKSGDKLELYKAREYEEFLLIKKRSGFKKQEVAIPKPKTFYRFSKSIIYIVDDSILDTKYDPEILNRIIRKKFIMSVFDALRPRINIKELIGYIATAGVIGFYMRDTTERISAWIQEIIINTPPETIQSLSQIVMVGAVIGIVALVIKMWRR